eukprot:8293076-Lingulodinium_polyedra.AAC.1
MLAQRACVGVGRVVAHYALQKVYDAMPKDERWFTPEFQSWGVAGADGGRAADERSPRRVSAER